MHKYYKISKEIKRYLGNLYMKHTETTKKSWKGKTLILQIVAEHMGREFFVDILLRLKAEDSYYAAEATRKA